jgi:uncharacterized protein (DUF302 family)
MLYHKTTHKNLDELDQAIRAAAARQSFGVIAVHDLKQLMNSKGVEFGNEVRVYEVCNPRHAKAVLSDAPEVSSMLPCRISVYAGTGGVAVTTMLPTQLMKAFATTAAVQTTAAEVERAMVAIIDEAV